MAELTNLLVSRKSVDLIVRFEISSKAYYREKLEQPTWPGGASGVTIGIGYDLGYNTAARIRADWSASVQPDVLDALVGVAGVTGQNARSIIHRLRHIRIPVEVATEVFEQVTLPRFARDSRAAYPGIEQLWADAQGALLSLVFNRGSAMTGDRRREMHAIKALVVERDLPGIADQIVAMKRLWNKNVLPGLHKRRDAEAKLVREARSTYPAGETFDI